MTGEALRKRLKTIEIDGKKIVFSRLAETLKLDRQGFNSKLNAKRVDYEFIKEIAEALQINISELTKDKEGVNIDELKNTPDMTDKYLAVLEENKKLQQIIIQAQQQTIMTQRELIDSEKEKVALLKSYGISNERLNRKR